MRTNLMIEDPRRIRVSRSGVGENAMITFWAHDPTGDVTVFMHLHRDNPTHMLALEEVRSTIVRFFAETADDRDNSSEPGVGPGVAGESGVEHGSSGVQPQAVGDRG